MKLNSISLNQYMAYLNRTEPESIFQIPCYHYIRQLIHPGEYRLDPLILEHVDGFYLIPLLIREKIKSYAEFIVPFNSIFSKKPLENSDYVHILEALKKRHPYPYRIKIASTLSNPHPFDSQFSRGNYKITQNHTYVLDLPERFEDWLTRLSRSTRYKIRKTERRAEKLGISVLEKGIEGLDDFLDLFYHRFYNHPKVLETFPGCFFLQLFKQMPPGSVKIYEARYEGKVIASRIAVFTKRECFAHSSVYDREYKNLSASDLLHSHIIRFLIGKKFLRYNFGGTGNIATLSQFKEKYRARFIEYDQLQWKNRRLSFKRYFRFPPVKKLRIKKMILLKNDLPGKMPPPPPIPSNLEWFSLETIEELERLVSEKYELRARGPEGKIYMNEKIARDRLFQKQILILVFRRKKLVHTRSLVLSRSLSFVRLIPPLNLSESESYSWHGNTTAFFRMLGYHKLFTNLISHLQIEKGIKRVFVMVREDNIPAIKARISAGCKAMGTFYLIRWKKHIWYLGYKKLLKSLEKNV